MQAVPIILIILAVIAFPIIRHKIHSKEIEKKVASLGGELIKISYRNFFTDIGPFKIVGKGRVVYKFEYREQDQVKEGWVRFGGVLGADWQI